MFFSYRPKHFQRFYNTTDIFRGYGNQEVYHHVTRVFIEPANNPKIHKRRSVIRQDEEISRMRVCMKESVNEYLLKDGIGAICGNRLLFFVRMRLGQVIAHSNASDFFCGNYLWFRIFPKNPGDMNGCTTLKVFAKFIDIVRLIGKIYLLCDNPGKLINNADRVKELDILHISIGQLG